MEMKAYRQMALLSSAFAFGWSKWNMQCGSEKVIFKVEYAKTHNTTLSSKRKGTQKNIDCFLLLKRGLGE